MSGAVPCKIASGFTTAENAVLTIIARDVQDRGFCDATIGRIAIRAGTSRSVVKRALRRAAELGLIHVRERRRPGLTNLENIVTIVSDEWRAWLRLGGGRGPKSNLNGNHIHKQPSAWLTDGWKEPSLNDKRGRGGTKGSARGGAGGAPPI